MESSELSKTLSPFYLSFWCMIFHAAQVMGRRSLALSAPSFLTSAILTREQIGMLSSMWRLSLAFWKFPASAWIDSLEPRVVISTAWLGSGVCCILFSFSQSSYAMLLCWMCDAAFVSFAWPATVKQLRQWCTEANLAIWMSLYSGASSLVASVGPSVLLQAAVWLETSFVQPKWTFIFFLPGIISVLVSLTFLMIIPTTSGKCSKESQRPLKKPMPLLARFQCILSAPGFPLFVSCTALGHVVKTILCDWFVVMAMEVGVCSEEAAQFAIGWFDVGMMIGVLLSGLIANSIATWLLRLAPSNPKREASSRCNQPSGKSSCLMSLKKHRHTALCTCMCAFALGTIWSVNQIMAHVYSTSQSAGLSLLLALGGFFMGGQLSIVGVSLLESWPIDFVGAVVGLNGLGAQIGALASGWPVAYLVRAWGGWEHIGLCLNAVTTLLFLCTGSAFYLTSRT